jgi:alkylated DNA repair protein alkB family protein 6
MHYYDLPAREPVLSLLLEPRSLVITTEEQYTARAHGIDSVTQDRVGEFVWANADMVGSGLGGRGEGATSGPPTEGEVLPRGTRYSLTFRDVARVMNVSVGGSARLGTLRV